VSVARPRATSVWERYVSGNGLTLTLAGLLALTVSLPIQRANWVANMPPPVLISLLAIATAVLFERTGLREWRIHAYAAGIGLFVVVASAVSMTPGFHTIDRSVHLVQELGSWFGAWGTDEIKAGLVEFAILMLSLTWTVAYAAAWLALRWRHGWAPVLLGGIMLGIVLGNIAENKTLWLALFMGASVLLLIHLATARRMVVWREHRLTFDPTTVLMQSGYILGAALAVVLLVSVLPTPGMAPLGALRDSVQRSVEASEAQFSRLFNGLPSRRSYRTITYGAETKFSGNPNLTDDLLFTVRGTRGTYWRARTYTDYIGTGWETGDAEFGPFTSGDGLPYEWRVLGEHEFKVSAATDTFFTAGLPLSFDEGAEALVWFDAPWDVLQVRYSEGRDFFPTRTNLNYVSIGIESTATYSQLRLAEGEYPEWVTDRYLQLPDSFPQRVRQLAEDLTAELDNPLDKIEALRDHVISLPYNLDINAPPEGVDGVEYFLFGIRQGYCDYYASSLAVMARSLGIPARYVLGYASGQFDPGSNSYRVLELNYHSWVEVYFPEYGWMPFEATPPNAIEFGGGVSLSAPPGVVESFDFSGDGLLLDEEEEEGLGDAFGADEGFGPSLRAILTVLAIAAVAALGFTWWRWWLRLGSLDRADELYAKMLRLAVLLGIPQRRDQTPIEYGESLGEEMPESVADILTLSRAYANRRYAGYPVSMQQLRYAEESWARLRWRMIKRMFRVRPA